MDVETDLFESVQKHGNPAQPMYVDPSNASGKVGTSHSKIEHVSQGEEIPVYGRIRPNRPEIHPFSKNPIGQQIPSKSECNNCMPFGAENKPKSKSSTSVAVSEQKHMKLNHNASQQQSNGHSISNMHAANSGEPLFSQQWPELNGQKANGNDVSPEHHIISHNGETASGKVPNPINSQSSWEIVPSGNRKSRGRRPLIDRLNETFARILNQSPDTCTVPRSPDSILKVALKNEYAETGMEDKARTDLEENYSQVQQNLKKFEKTSTDCDQKFVSPSDSNY